MKDERPPIVLICLDGCSWEYIRSVDMPHLKEMSRSGVAIMCKSMVPTLTNINNASILTGEFPIKHGITGNYYFDKLSSSEVYMDSWSFLRCPTLLEKASTKGLKTLLLTVKDKLARLLNKGVTTTFSVEKPSPWILQKLGRPPSIYSTASVSWMFDAALLVLEKKRYDISYISTTDYIPHKYAPGCAEAKEYLEIIDDKIRVLMEKDIGIGVTADHGMSDKRIKVDLKKILTESKIDARIIPTIKDEYVEHHGNLGGAVYIYLKKGLRKALEVLQATEGVESVLRKHEAAKLFKLPSDRIGDLLVFGTKPTVFGDADKNFREEINIRSHGSLHESEVPFITNQEVRVTPTFFNKDSLLTLQKNRVFMRSSSIHILSW